MADTNKKRKEEQLASLSSVAPAPKQPKLNFKVVPQSEFGKQQLLDGIEYKALKEKGNIIDAPQQVNQACARGIQTEANEPHVFAEACFHCEPVQ